MTFVWLASPTAAPPSSPHSRVAPPYHTIVDVGLIGGGQVPMPAEVSLAHHGVRCLDARPECRRHALEVLRQPLEEGVTTDNLEGILNLAALAAMAE